MGKPREYAEEAASRLRDRRRKERQRLEDIFDRKTFVSLLVLGTASKVIERLFVPIIAREPVEWNIAGAYVFMFLASTWAAVYWKELAESAGDAVDAASDAVESASGDNSE